MSHFTVMVIGENPEEQLEPFDENRTMPRYVKHTKQQLIEKGRKDIEDYKNGRYAEYLADPQAYKENCNGNLQHFKYISEEFPEKLTWTDEQVYEAEVAWYESENIGKDGEVYSTSNPQGNWDWYELGGRWTGFFELKENAEDFEIGTPGLMTKRAKINTADSAMKKDIDFEGMRNKARKEAAKRYDKVHKAIKDTPEHMSWENVRENVKPIDKARQVYGDQPRVKAFEKAEMGFMANVEEYMVPREEYLEKETASAICPYAVIHKYQWFAKGEMGWWGMSFGDMKEEEWAQKVNTLIDSLPDDTFISLYDCHI